MNGRDMLGAVFALALSGFLVGFLVGVAVGILLS